MIPDRFFDPPRRCRSHGSSVSIDIEDNRFFNGLGILDFGAFRGRKKDWKRSQEDREQETKDAGEDSSPQEVTFCAAFALVPRFSFQRGTRGSLAGMGLRQSKWRRRTRLRFIVRVYSFATVVPRRSFSIRPPTLR